MGTADFTDYTDDKRVSFAARASDSSFRFRIQAHVYRVIRVIRGFNFGKQA
jgi:hypothetical protein